MLTLLLVVAFVIPITVLAVRRGRVPENASVSESPRSASGDSKPDSLFAWVPSAASANTVQPGISQEKGYPVAPDFERVTLDGTPLRLSSQRGQVVVLNFWATWCAPCRLEIPGFIELQHEMGSKGLRFIGVSLDEDGFAVVRSFAEEMEITYPLVIGDEALASKYGGIPGLPTTFVLDRHGHIRQRFVGMVSEETLRPVLADLLREEAPEEGQH